MSDQPLRRADDSLDPDDMSPAHKAMLERITGVETEVRTHVHPQIETIIAILKGPVDDLTGEHHETEGMESKLDEVLEDVRGLKQAPEAGTIRLDAKVVAGIAIAFLTGVFALLEATIGIITP